MGLVDFDPQGSATIACGMGLDAGPLADAIIAGEPLPFVATPFGFDLACGGPDLSSVEPAITAKRPRDPAATLVKCLRAHDYDALLLDCGPSFGFLMFNALVASDLVLCPAQPAILSVSALGEMLDTIQEFRGGGSSPELAGVVLTSVDGRSEASNEEAREAIHALAPGKLMDAEIHQAKVIQDAQQEGEPVGVFAPTSRAAKEHEALADELWRGM